MIKCKLWKNEGLKGRWEATYKIDGVRASSDGKTVISRNGKPLYNLDHLAHTFTDAEVFLGDFKTTIEAVRTRKEVKEVKQENIYSFDPVDPRLFIGFYDDPSEAEIVCLYQSAILKGMEGIVLKQGDRWWKVKAHETFDVPCIEFHIGTGKFSNTLGKIETPLGLVGTGFSNEERDWFWQNKPHGVIIEVECNRLTESGVFRHASFKHIRWDKS